MRENRPSGSEGGAGTNSLLLPLCALGSEYVQEGESLSLVELNASNRKQLRHREVRWRATGSEWIVRRTDESNGDSRHELDAAGYD